VRSGRGQHPSDSTDLTTSAGRSDERTTSYQAYDEVLSTSYSTVEAEFDYALRKGQKASPVEQARRRFLKRIEEDDTVELAERPRAPNKWTVVVVRDGRLVALVKYHGGRGRGWILQSALAHLSASCTSEAPPSEVRGTLAQSVCVVSKR